MTKYIDIEEFREIGFLQEANRQFFHPLGLALEVQVDDDGNWSLGGIWDYRDDPEGVLFVDLTSEEDIDRAVRVSRELAEHREARMELFGYSNIQPFGSRFEK